MSAAVSAPRRTTGGMTDHASAVIEAAVLAAVAIAVLTLFLLAQPPVQASEAPPSAASAAPFDWPI